MSDNDDLKERLAARKAELAALEEEREAREERQRLEAELEATERHLRDARVIAEVEVAHGPIDDVKLARVDTELGVVVVKRPPHVLYKRFRDAKELTTEDFEKLVRPCLVHPDRSGFDALVEQKPAILDRTANAVVKLAGFRLKELAGK